MLCWLLLSRYTSRVAGIAGCADRGVRDQQSNRSLTGDADQDQM